MERFGDDDLAVRETVASWADRAVLGPRATAKEGYDALVRRAMGELQKEVGLGGAMFPEALGGAGRDGPDVAYLLTLAVEEVGRADVGLAFSLACSQAVAATALLGPGEPRAALHLAKLLGSGEPLAEVALVLPQLASRERAHLPRVGGRTPQASARRVTGGWIVEAAEARPLHAGQVASALGVVCDVKDEPPVLLLVPVDAKGVERGQQLRQTGLGASPNCGLCLREVRLATESLVASGEEALRFLETWLRLLTAASAVGALRAAHAILSDWGENRVIKGRGQVFKENPLTASVMADLVTRLHTSRLLVYDLAHFVAHPETYGPAGSAPVHTTGASVHGTVMASAETALGHAMELMASAGYAREWFLERYWRDLKCVRSLLGGEMLSRMAVARHAYQANTLL